MYRAESNLVTHVRAIISTRVHVLMLREQSRRPRGGHLSCCQAAFSRDNNVWRSTTARLTEVRETSL